MTSYNRASSVAASIPFNDDSLALGATNLQTALEALNFKFTNTFNFSFSTIPSGMTLTIPQNQIMATYDLEIQDTAELDLTLGEVILL